MRLRRVSYAVVHCGTLLLCVQAFVLVFLLMLVLVLTIADHVVGHLVNHRLTFAIPESAVTMFLGMVLGGVITLLCECMQLFALLLAPAHHMAYHSLTLIAL